MKRTKKLTAMLLAIVMVISFIPAISADVGDVLTFNYDASNADITEYNAMNLFWPIDATSKTDEKTTAYLDDSSTYVLTYTGVKSIKYTTDSDTYYMYELKPGGTNKAWPKTYSGGVYFNVKVPKGTYKIKQVSYNYWLYGGDVAIYIDGQYAGTQYNTEYNASATSSACSRVTTELNTLSLNSGEKDFVKIEFRPIKLYYNGARSLRIYPIETVFEEVEESTLSDISYDIENTTIILGESTDISASALMSDGSLHHFADYDATGKADTYDSIEITQLNGEDFVELSEVQNHSNKITAKLTAKEAGTADIKITAQIGNETKEKIVTITAEAPPKLASVALSADKESLPAGRQAKLSFALTRDDGKEYIGDKDIAYEVEDIEGTDVVSVAEDGTITAKNEGKAKVKITVTATDGSDVVVEDYVEITVTARPKLSDIKIQTSKDVYVINEIGSFSVVGIMDDGLEATADELAAYTFTYENDDESVIALSTENPGEFTAIGEGTAEITASTVKENGRTLTSSKVVEVKAKADRMTVDFSLTTTANHPIDGKTHWEVTSTPGYEIVEAESCLSSWRKYTTWPDGKDRLHIATSGGGVFWPEEDRPEKKVTITVDFPVAGWYSTYLTGGQNYAGGWYSVFGNGAYLGDYSFYQPTEQATSDWRAGPEKRLNTAYYEAGKNKITFCLRGTVYVTPYLLLQSLSFVPESVEPTTSHIESTPEVPTELVVGEMYNLEAVAKMTDGSDYNIGVNADGSMDTENYLTVSSDKTDIIEVSEVKGYEPGSSGKLTYKITAKNTGFANLTLSANVRGNTVEKVVPIEVTNEDIGSTELTNVPDEMYIGQSITLGAKNVLSGGRVLGDGIAENVYTSSKPEIAEVQGDILIAKSAGESDITVATTFLGVTVYDTKTIKVSDEVIKDIEITAGGSEHIRLTDDPDDTVPLYITATTNKGREIDLSDTEITYTAHNPGLADIDEKGTIYPKAEGEAEFSVSFEFNKSQWNAKKTLTVARGKARFTYYTEAEREAARENGKKYDWAKQTVEKATANADEYVAQLDKLYNMIPSEGIPRAFVIAVKGDPEAYICKYCGIDIRKDYGNYSYNIDSLTRPWKIQCPDCKRLFPSNDFESLYKLGLNEYGEYSAERAREKNQELIDSGFFANHTSPAVRKYGYLGNELYPEVGSADCPVKLNPGEDPLGWGADDGLGYVTGKVLDNDIPERYNFLAYYLHWGLFRSASGGFSKGHIYKAIGDCADAYVYTGDKKYGRVAAILLDRLADFYPGYDLSIYGENIQNSDGGTMKGKTIGRIWETGALGTYIKAYDAVFDMYDDPEVLAYIGNKAKSIKMRHAKNTPSQIRTNIEDGLIREGLEAIRRNQVSGNFGYPQSANAIAAVVLDSMPETKYWLDYLMAPGWTNKGNYSPGGGIYDRIVNEVDHDGQGNEASDYNTDWMVTLLGIQEALDDYDAEAFASASLYNNPKFVRMFYAHIPMIMSSYTPEIGDSQSTAERSLWLEADNAIRGYRKLGDERLAQYVYMCNGNKTDGIHESIFTKDPENIQNEIEEIIAEKGPLTVPSEMLTGFGFAALRDGVEFTDVTAQTQFDNRHGFWMYFGYNSGHGHKDTLNLGMDAFGLNFMPELGYPEETQKQPNRLQWVGSTISHNTVIVDEKEQKVSDVRGKSLHFDDSEMVQLMDVDAKDVYPQTDVYRRSVVMVKIDDNNFYGVDFFRIKGGNDHLYSLHTLSDEICDTEGLELIPQTDESGSYKGTYAGLDAKYIKNEKTGAVRAYTEGETLAENEVILEAEFGKDPNSPDEWEYDTIFPRGYTWLKNVDRDNSQSEQFEVDFKIKDFKKALKGNVGDLHLRATMLSAGVGTTVSTADGYPPQKAENKAIPSLRYLLVKRTGENLDTMFTTVLEPYRETRTLSGVEELALSIKEGTEAAGDTHRAVKVTHQDGTVDYVFYATNNEVTYTLEDDGTAIDFRGFVGVYRLKDGANIYKYVCDGDIIGESTGETVSIKGRVSSFTDVLSFENEIRVKLSAPVDETIVSDLANRYIFIENNGLRNGSYKIEGAKLDTETGELVLDIGTATLIRKYKDPEDLNGGFVYNIDRRNDCVIPLSFEDASLPTFGTYTDGQVSAGSRYEQVITAQAADGGKATITGEDMPRGASFNSDTNTFVWRPDSSQIGDNHVSLTATDEYGRKATIHFIVTVYGSTTGGSSSNKTDETEKTETPSDETTTPSGGGGGGGGGGGAAPTDTPDDATDTDQTEQGGESGEDENSEGNTDNTGTENGNLRFIDLGNHAWARDAINTLADDGIIRGTTSDTYSPANNITRADFALLLVRAFELSSDNTENFADVDASDYFAPELAIARNTGIVDGIGDNKYAPRNSITRQDMMVIVYRTLNSLPLEGKGDRFAVDEVENDISAESYPDYSTVADYAKEAVSALIGAGLVNGKSGKIAPTDFTTRAEVAVLIKRILDYVK